MSRPLLAPESEARQDPVGASRRFHRLRKVFGRMRQNEIFSWWRTEGNEEVFLTEGNKGNKGELGKGFSGRLLVQCIIDLVIVYLLSLVGVDKTLEIGAA